MGKTLRIRARKFPAIVNCTSIDWFHEWPEEALVSVSSRFLSEVELIKVCVIIIAGQGFSKIAKQLMFVLGSLSHHVIV